VHNQSVASRTLSFAHRPGPAGAPTVTVRPAARADVEQITELVSEYAAEGLMLPRTVEQIALNIDNYIIAVKGGRLVACAALEEYSPSLAEVSSVAVARTEQGNGLGKQVVLSVERLARARDIDEIFALSLTDKFFLALDYLPTAISRYPEKLSRYESLASAGVDIVPKHCFRKTLGNDWQLPQLVETPAAQTSQVLRAS
jgi:amino-acid N-acetyltransferase